MMLCVCVSVYVLVASLDFPLVYRRICVLDVHRFIIYLVIKLARNITEKSLKWPKNNVERYVFSNLASEMSILSDLRAEIPPTVILDRPTPYYLNLLQTLA